MHCEPIPIHNREKFHLLKSYAKSFRMDKVRMSWLHGIGFGPSMCPLRKKMVKTRLVQILKKKYNGEFDYASYQEVINHFYVSF